METHLLPQLVEHVRSSEPLLGGGSPTATGASALIVSMIVRRRPRAIWVRGRALKPGDPGKDAGTPLFRSLVTPRAAAGRGGTGARARGRTATAAASSSIATAAASSSIATAAVARDMDCSGKVSEAGWA
jgi:hypothetical protein